MASCPYRKILVPFDGSPGARKALEKAMVLANSSEADVIALWIDEDVPRYAPGVGKVEEKSEVRAEEFALIDALVREMSNQRAKRVKTDCVVGHAAHAILRYAQEKEFDIIVIGHSGYSGVWGALLGSTTARVVDRALCDVLVVR